jgi:hypothetical protein
MSPRKKVVQEVPVPDESSCNTRAEVGRPRVPIAMAAPMSGTTSLALVTRLEGPGRDCGFVADALTGKRLAADRSGQGPEGAERWLSP